MSERPGSLPCSQRPHDQNVLAMGEERVSARSGWAGEKERAVEGNQTALTRNEWEEQG